VPHQRKSFLHRLGGYGLLGMLPAFPGVLNQ
jgi:hypothetical protein